MTTSEAVLKQTGMNWLTLFASGGTLICCALPIILVYLTELGNALGHLDSGPSCF